MTRRQTAQVSDKELVAHVLRRLGMGTHPALATAIDSPQGVLNPGNLMGAFKLLQLLDDPPSQLPNGGAFEALGLYDVAKTSRDVVGRGWPPMMSFALAYGSPEFALT